MVLINKVAPYNFNYNYSENIRNCSENYYTKPYKNDEFVKSVSFKGRGKEYNAHIPEGCFVARRIEKDINDLSLNGGGHLSRAKSELSTGNVIYKYAKEYLSSGNRYKIYDEFGELADIYTREKDGSITVRKKTQDFSGMTFASDIYKFDKDGKLKTHAAVTTEDKKGNIIRASHLYLYNENGIPEIIYEDADFNRNNIKAEKLYCVSSDVEKHEIDAFMGEYKDALECVFCDYENDGKTEFAKKLYILPGNEDFDEYEGEYENYIRDLKTDKVSYDKHYIIDKQE